MYYNNEHIISNFIAYEKSLSPVMCRDAIFFFWGGGRFD